MVLCERLPAVFATLVAARRPVRTLAARVANQMVAPVARHTTLPFSHLLSYLSYLYLRRGQGQTLLAT